MCALGLIILDLQGMKFDIYMCVCVSAYPQTLNGDSGTVRRDVTTGQGLSVMKARM